MAWVFGRTPFVIDIVIKSFLMTEKPRQINRLLPLTLFRYLVIFNSPESINIITRRRSKRNNITARNPRRSYPSYFDKENGHEQSLENHVIQKNKNSTIYYKGNQLLGTNEISVRIPSFYIKNKKQSFHLVRKNFTGSTTLSLVYTVYIFSIK